jgi:uncharacterized protein (DUF169 family)
MMHTLIHAPLEEANFDPDIIVMISNPAKAMQLTQAMVYTLCGGR